LSTTQKQQQKTGAAAHGLKLLQLSPSFAAIEPVFTKFGVAQTKLHNQLGVEKAARLVMSCRELSGKSELDWSLK
jgi:hypothetical protein